MVRFNKEIDKLLIELVKNFNALYDKSDKEHKNYIYKHQCWEKISEVVGFPVSECKKRFKSLRDQYNKKTKDGGTGSAKINSTWEYMEILSFLSDAPERRVSISNIYSEEMTENDSQTTEVNTDTDDEPDYNIQETKTENKQTIQDNINDFSPAPSTSKKRKPNTRKLQKSLDKQQGKRLQLIETLVNNTKTSDRSLAKSQSATKKFFESMAEVVETFPPREQAVIRAKVCQLVSDTEIKLSSAVTSA